MRSEPLVLPFRQAYLFLIAPIVSTDNEVAFNVQSFGLYVAVGRLLRATFLLVLMLDERDLQPPWDNMVNSKIEMWVENSAWRLKI